LAFDLYCVGQLAFFQRGTKVRVVAVAGVGHHRGRPQSPLGQLVEHLHRQHPLRAIPFRVRDATPGTPPSDLHAAASSARASSQLSGTNSRQFTAAEAVSVTMCTLTPTWQLVTLPAVPVYCRATHGDRLPSLSNPVSSITHAIGPTVRCASLAHRARPDATSPL